MLHCNNTLITITAARKLWDEKGLTEKKEKTATLQTKSRGQNEQNGHSTHTHTKTSLNRKIGEKINRTNSQAMKKTLTPQHHSTCIPLKRLQVLLLCSMAMSTSIKKEINGPGASEWTHSHRTHPCHVAAMSKHRGGTETTEAQCLEVVWIPTRYRKQSLL